MHREQAQSKVAAREIAYIRPNISVTSRTVHRRLSLAGISPLRFEKSTPESRASSFRHENSLTVAVACAGILSGKGPQAGGSQVEMEAMLAQHPAYDKGGAAWLQTRAYDCWWKPGHPGWSVWPADSEQFIRGVVEAGDAILAPVQIIAPVPTTPHSRYHPGTQRCFTGPSLAVAYLFACR